MQVVKNDSQEIKAEVRSRYGQAARQVLEQPTARTSCCTPAELTGEEVILLQDASAACCDPQGSGATNGSYAALLYDQAELSGLPEGAMAASLGCGNPTAIAALQPGQTVLDLGSGGGIDCFLAARQVGPGGQVIGLDMTPDMIELAERNKAKLGEAAANVSFRLGEMEAMPVADQSIDVVISNCVINLSPNKDAVFGEIYRVLRAGGILTVSDIVALRPLPATLRGNAAAWSECVSGALEVATYVDKLQAAGFVDVEVSGVAPAAFDQTGSDQQRWIASATIVAHKPR